MRASVYIVLSDFQAKVALSLINESRNHDEVILVAPLSLRNRYFSEIHCCYIPVPYTTSSQDVAKVFLRAGKEKKVLKKILNLVSSFTDLTFYVAHFEGFLANWIFCKYRNSKNVNISLIQDGTLTYYFCRPNKNKMIAKKIISMIWLERFKHDLDEITLIGSDKILKNYVAFGTEYTLVPGKSFQINVDDRKRKTIGNVALIVGQEPIIEKIGVGPYRLAVQSMIKSAYEKSDKLLYVYHPRADQKLKGIVGPVLAEAAVGTIALNCSAEDYVMSEPEIRYIYAHSSSALFLIKITLKEQVECYFSAQEGDGFAPEIKSVFRAAGVKFL